MAVLYQQLAARESAEIGGEAAGAENSAPRKAWRRLPAWRLWRGAICQQWLAASSCQQPMTQYRCGLGG